MAYGIEVYDASGNITLSSSDRVGFFIARLSGTLAANTSIDIPVSGINSTTTKAIVYSSGRDSLDPIFGVVETNNVSLTNISNDAEDYIVLLTRFT